MNTSAQNTDFDQATLADWGEFRFIDEVLLPLINSDNNRVTVGNDCAVIPMRGSDRRLIVTSDASPVPLASQLGMDDWFVWGWYSVLINASDLAAAAAEPVAFTTSVEAPATMSVRSFRDFFTGILAGCRAFNLANAGGNIRQAPRFECHGTAIGECPPDREPLTRSGAKPGDALVAVGSLGRCICAYLKARVDGLASLDTSQQDSLLRPTARMREMIALAEQRFVTSASDNSDGVLGAIWNILEKSNVGAILELDQSVLADEILQTAKRFDLNPWNLAFFWGDWQVIASIDGRKFDDFLRFAAAQSIPYEYLGRIVDGPIQLLGRSGTQIHKLNLIRNENFKADSYNSAIQDQVNYLLHTPLIGGRP
jgi:thiamine-monophosphate kinase